MKLGNTDGHGRGHDHHDEHEPPAGPLHQERGPVVTHAEPDHHPAGGTHQHPTGVMRRVRERVAPHSHDAGDVVDNELETSQRGIRALVLSFAGLGVTAVLQGAVALLSGSVALLGDSLHNLADALTAVPLAIAFTLGRRLSTRRFTYGYGRSEDLAGLAIVLLMAASATLAGYEAIRRLLVPQAVTHLPLVAVAALVGFAGNELVAQYRIRVGRAIGSAALVADGLHARTDGFTSLAVLAGAGGAALGLRLADPIVGLIITAVILVVLRQAVRQVFARLMDAVDPTLVGRVEAVVRATPGVLGTGQIRLRWIGHALRAECEITVDPRLSIREAHRIAEDTQHRLLHQVRRLTAAMVHADPEPGPGDDHHELSAHHRASLRG